MAWDMTDECLSCGADLSPSEVEVTGDTWCTECGDAIDYAQCLRCVEEPVENAICPVCLGRCDRPDSGQQPARYRGGKLRRSFGGVQ